MTNFAAIIDCITCKICQRMKNPMIENKANGFQELVWEYLSATRMFQPHTNDSLKMFGALLYLAKIGNLY